MSHLRISPNLLSAQCLIAAALAGSALLYAQTTESPIPSVQHSTASAQKSVAAAVPQAPAITEEELRRQLQGKTFYLRNGYLDNSLHFDEDGKLDGSSPKASFTLSLVEITRVHLEKHKLELEAVRYGLHFLGALPSEDQTAAFDKVRLTTKKKPLHITIDRETVVNPKKPKEKKQKGVPEPKNTGGISPQATPEVIDTDRKGNRTTSSQDHANRALRNALDHVFAPDIDAKMIASLPEYWQLFYKAVEQKRNYRPADPSILHQSQVDKKARLLSVFEPPSNEYAQNNGVAGIAMYHVVVGADGKPGEIAVGRPIGFGLDENAVEAIRKARFEPAMKDGKPVPVVLDLTVQFRIFSDRTAATASTPQPIESPAQPKAPELPGPYTARALQQSEQQQAQPATQPGQEQPQSTTQQQQQPQPPTTPQ